MLQTPKLDHFTSEDYKKIYEPSEDTFLLLDTLEEQKDFIIDEIDPHLIIEIGLAFNIYFYKQHFNHY